MIPNTGLTTCGVYFLLDFSFRTYVLLSCYLQVLFIINLGQHLTLNVLPSPDRYNHTRFSLNRIFIHYALHRGMSILQHTYTSLTMKKCASSKQHFH